MVCLESFFDLSLEDDNNNFADDDPFNDDSDRFFLDLNLSGLGSKTVGGMERGVDGERPRKDNEERLTGGQTGVHDIAGSSGQSKSGGHNGLQGNAVGGQQRDGGGGSAAGVGEGYRRHAHGGEVRGGPKQRSRHPQAHQEDPNLDLLDPNDYLELNKNGNTRKNSDMALRQYERVMSRLSERGGEDFESLKEASVERLPYLLLKFLQSAKKSDGTVYAAGTINTIFNSLCNILSSRENEPVNIKTDVQFKKVREMLKVQTTKSALEGRGTGCDAKRAVTKEHLSMGLQAGTIGRNAPKPLSTSAYLGAVLGWGCRTGAECHMIQNKDLIFGPVNKKTGVPEWIELSERVTKTRTGNPGDERELVPRIFPDDEFPGTCYVRSLLEYQKRKTPAQRAADAPFFLNANPAAVKNPLQFQHWYVGSGKTGSGIMGVHMLESLVTVALQAAGVDCKLEKYSAISLRKSMLQSGVDCNVPDLHLSRLAGHKALVSKKAYVNSAGVHHKTTGRVIHRQLFHGVNRGYEKEMRDVEAVDVESSSEDERGGIRKKISASPLERRRKKNRFEGRTRKKVQRNSSSSIEARENTSRYWSLDRKRRSRSRSEWQRSIRKRSRDTTSRERKQRRSRSRSRARRRFSQSKERRSRSRSRARRRFSQSKERRSRSRSRNRRQSRSRDTRSRSRSRYRRQSRSRDTRSISRSKQGKTRRLKSRSRDGAERRYRSRSRDRKERRAREKNKRISRDGEERRSKDDEENRTKYGDKNRSRSRSIDRKKRRFRDGEERRSRDCEERRSRDCEKRRSRDCEERRSRDCEERSSRDCEERRSRDCEERRSRDCEERRSRDGEERRSRSLSNFNEKRLSLGCGKSAFSPCDISSSGVKRIASSSPLPGPSGAQRQTHERDLSDRNELSVEQYSKVNKTYTTIFQLIF